MIEINQSTPTAPGLYLWKPASTDVRLIEVINVPEHDSFGMHWEAYLAVTGMNKRHVGALRGTFSRQLVMTGDCLCEVLEPLRDKK